MNLLSLISCMLIVLLSMNIFRARIKKNSIIHILIITITVVLSALREVVFSNVVISGLYAMTCLIFLMIDEDRIKINDIGRLLVERKRYFYLSQMLFFFVLAIHFLEFGFTYGWNTMVLQGPYNYPHTLAYLLLFFLCADAYLVLHKMETIPIILTIINASCVMLTAVRSTIVCLAIIVMYVLWYYMNQKQFTKIVFIITGGIIVLVIAWKKGLFDAFIAKTLLSVSGGYGLTNNRAKTFISSIETYQYSRFLPVSLFFGTGLEELLAQNGRVLGAPIHAHNDFIDVFVSYGVINFIIYTTLFAKVCFKNSKRIWCLLFLGVLLFYNGFFVYIDALPLIIYPILLFNYTNKLKIMRTEKS